MVDRPTTSMKKGWLCRASCDEKNHEITPGMIQIDWWSRYSDDSQWWYRLSDDRDLVMIVSDDIDRVMIKVQWWWSSSDDLDQVIIEIQWWSKLRDDPDLVMMPHDDPDREMIQIQWWCPMMIHIERWSRSNDLKTQNTWDVDDKMIQLIQRRRLVLKIVSKEYLPS